MKNTNNMTINRGENNFMLFFRYRIFHIAKNYFVDY